MSLLNIAETRPVRVAQQLLVLAFIFAALSFPACSIPHPKQNNTSSTDIPRLGNILAGLEGSRVIFVGEAHTNEMDHRIQLEVIRRLKEDGKKVAVALEMFPNTLQPALNAWIKGEINEAAFRNIYYSTWTVPYSHYSRIFGYARENGLPLIGINIDPSYINYLKIHGIEYVPQHTLDSVKYSRCSEETRYTRDLKTFFGSIAHTMGFEAICDTMRLREAFMAYNLSTSLADNDYTIVVLLGAIHALKFAVPEMLEMHSNESYKVLVPERLIKHMGQLSIEEQADLTW